MIWDVLITIAICAGLGTIQWGEYLLMKDRQELREENGADGES